MMDKEDLPAVNIGERLNAIQIALRGKKPKDSKDVYERLSTILNPVVALGNRKRSDMVANGEIVTAIWNLHFYGSEMCEYFLVFYDNDNLASASIDNSFLEHMTSQEFKYTQKQELHEYPHAPTKKRSIFGRKKE